MIWIALLFTAVVGKAVAPACPSWLLGFPIGAAAISLQLLLYDLVRVPWNRGTVVAPWIALLAWRLWKSPDRFLWSRLGKRREQKERFWPGWIEWPPLVFGALALAAWVPYERLMPLNEWDAIMLWMFKGKAFYLDGGVAPYLARAPEFLGNAAYPLLVPLYATFLYVWMGEVADQAAKLLSPCFWASLVAGFYYLVRRWNSRAVAVTFTAMLAGLHIVNFVAFHYAGYADTTVAVAVLMGAGFFYAWLRGGEYRDFALAIAFGAIGAWTKNEGLFFLAGLGALAGLGLLWRRVRDWRCWAALAGLPALAVVPWAVARSLYGIRRPGQLSGEILQTNLPSYWPTLKALVEHAFAPEVFNLVFPLWLAALALHRRAGLDWKYLALPALVLWQLLGVTLVYITGPVSLRWMIGSSLDRVLSQIAPLALLGAAVVFGAYDEARSRDPEARSHKVKRRRNSTSLR
jgi:hypothetical protein